MRRFKNESSLSWIHIVGRSTCLLRNSRSAAFAQVDVHTRIVNQEVAKWLSIPSIWPRNWKDLSGVCYKSNLLSSFSFVWSEQNDCVNNAHFNGGSFRPLDEHFSTRTRTISACGSFQRYGFQRNHFRTGSFRPKHFRWCTFEKCEFHIAKRSESNGIERGSGLCCVPSLQQCVLCQPYCVFCCAILQCVLLCTNLTLLTS